MNKNIDVVALGELLIDFTSAGKSDGDNFLFEANPGGAPSNVLAMLKKLGNTTAFIGKVGDDIFGHMLSKKGSEQGIDMSGLMFDGESRTTLAFVNNDSSGDRSFSFYRNPGADTRLSTEDVRIKKDLIERAKVFHFGSLSMTDSPAKEATEYAVLLSKEAGNIISFDPNYRPPLWKKETDAFSAMWYGVRNCNVLKISDDEIYFLTGEKDIDIGVEYIRKENPKMMVFATMGAEGSKAYYKDIKVFSKGIKSEKTIETTGAGDTFCGCILHFILKYGLDKMDENAIIESLRFANAAASIVTTRKGAMSVMPTEREITEYLC
ncbi:MAG: carbohydrate kinase [Lachnospiraceae bacterium]|nr:carbohydrate kinase [Lachnospiraceae bacterium]